MRSRTNSLESIQVTVLELTTPPAPGRVLGLAWVRISTPDLTFKCGPWRVVDRLGTDPAVLPPDVRQGGRWVDTIELPEPTLHLVEEAVLVAFRENDKEALR